MKWLVAIVGPTGVGKTRLAVYLAGIFNGEIIGADSRQVYRYMDIGTAKPAPEEMSLITHHLIDIVDPDEDFNLGRYLELANSAIDDINGRNKLPFLVGGTGQYIKAVLEGWQVPRVSPDRQFRYNIEKKVGAENADNIYNELMRLDPEAAGKIDRRNVRRVARALEVRIQTGENFSRIARKKVPSFKTFIIGLTTERKKLYEIVDGRVDDMIGRGLVPEVEKLLKMGYHLNLSSMSGIGYRQVVQYLNGEITLEAAIQKMKTETHRFIRHQYAWFRLTDDRIHWFDIVQHKDEEIASSLESFLREN